MDRVAALVVLFALGAPGGVPTGLERPALVQHEPTKAPELDPEMLIGAWRGSQGREGDILEIVFANDIRPGTVVAHFTSIQAGATQTVRRLGQLTDNGVRFGLVGGGQIVLTFADDNRLVGGFLPGSPSGPIDLVRLRRR
jgi:hypothetical protein